MLYALVGQTVYPKVTMEGHAFLPLNSDVIHETKYFRGIHVTLEKAASGELFNHDFVDITQAEVRGAS